jgi:hypothetical protein
MRRCLEQDDKEIENAVRVRLPILLEPHEGG